MLASKFQAKDDGGSVLVNEESKPQDQSNSTVNVTLLTYMNNA